MKTFCLQDEFPVTRTGESSDTWMGRVQWCYCFPIPWSQKLCLGTAALSLSFRIPPLGICMGSGKKINQINDSFMLFHGGLPWAGSIRHPKIWAQVHEQIWSQSLWYLWANLLVRFHYVWDFIHVFKSQLSDKQSELRGFITTNSIAAVVCLTRTSPQLTGHGQKSVHQMARIQQWRHEL